LNFEAIKIDIAREEMQVVDYKLSFE